MRNNHLAAKRDVENNEVPLFNESGYFQPTSGMQLILGQQEYHPLFNLEAEEMRLEERKSQKSQLILKLEGPVLELREWVLGEVDRIRRYREEVLQDLGQRKEEMVKHESEMRYNGFHLDASESSQGFFNALRSRLGALLVFILIELIVFGATYYVLEEIMGTVELVVRVLINGVVFGSIDFVRRRKRHGWRTAFLLLFLLLYTAMLVGPLATHSLHDAGSAVVSGWSLTEESGDSPIQGFSFVRFLFTYHQYLLFVLWISLFVVYVSFSRQIPEKEHTTKDAESNESRVWPLIHAGMADEVKKLEGIVEKLETQMKEVECEALENLEELHAKLQALDKEYEDLGAEQSRLHTKQEILLSNIMAALKGYESHYMQQLEKTPKNLVLQPRWPSKEDIKAYFNIRY